MVDALDRWRACALRGVHLDPRRQDVCATCEPMPEVGEWLRRVLNGFYQYDAVPGNWDSLKMFRRRIGRCWRHVLRRRSQRGRLSAERLTRLFSRWLIPPRLVHPYPSVRFDAMHPGRMR